MRETKESERSNNPAGSPTIGEPAFLVVGMFLHPHGLKGELLMEVMTDFPERLVPGVTIFAGNTYQPLRIRSRRQHKNSLLLAFDDFHDREAVGVFRNQWAYVSTSDRPTLPDGEYYHHQLLGLRVVSDDGSVLGNIVKILETGANDVYVVRKPDGKEILLPAINQVILEINLEKGEMIVHLLVGLID